MVVQWQGGGWGRGVKHAKPPADTQVTPYMPPPHRSKPATALPAGAPSCRRLLPPVWSVPGCSRRLDGENQTVCSRGGGRRGGRATHLCLGDDGRAPTKQAEAAARGDGAGRRASGPGPAPSLDRSFVARGRSPAWARRLVACTMQGKGWRRMEALLVGDQVNLHPTL